MSWRLLLIDLLMMVYLLAVLAVTVVMGIDVDVNVVANALFKYVYTRGRARTQSFWGQLINSKSLKLRLLCASGLILLHPISNPVQPCERDSSQRPGALAALLPAAIDSYSERHDGDLQ